MDLDAVADTLYGLPPAQFTAARNARAAQARADGDRALAERIRRLERPTTAAWLVNLLSRELAAEVEPLITLGRDLRQASASLGGEQMRALTRQRHALVQALVGQARALAGHHDVRVSDSVAEEVRRTLDASLGDPAVAEEVLTGRLTRARAYAGFGETGATSAHSPGPPPTSRAAAAVPDLTERRREAAGRALAEADERLAVARGEHAGALRERDDAVREHDTATADLRVLTTQLRAAEDRAASADRAQRAAGRRLDAAQQALERAERHRDQAAGQVADLEG